MDASRKHRIYVLLRTWLVVVAFLAGVTLIWRTIRGPADLLSVPNGLTTQQVRTRYGQPEMVTWSPNSPGGESWVYPLVKDGTRQGTIFVTFEKGIVTSTWESSATNGMRDRYFDRFFGGQ